MGQLLYDYYGLPNNPPVITEKEPDTDSEIGDAIISFVVSDSTGEAVQSSLDVDIIQDPNGTPITENMIINGVFQTPDYDGTIVPNVFGGFDVEITTHPYLADAEYRITVYVEDTIGDYREDQWDFEVATTPILLNLITTGRRTIELEFDLPIVVRNTSIGLINPSDQWTPVDWISHGGGASDAANPANYVITRPSSGSLTEPGEAVELTVTKAEEVPEYSSISLGKKRSTRIKLTTDFQHTANASYLMQVSNVVYDISPIQTEDGQWDFKGFIVSNVNRNSINLYYDLFSRVHRLADSEIEEQDFLKFCTVFQEVFNRLLEDIDAFYNELCSIDYLSESAADATLFDFGNPFYKLTVGLSLNKKRKLCSLLISIYKQVGTEIGIKNVVRFFLGYDAISDIIYWWSDNWILGVSELGTETVLGPGNQYDLYSFWVVTSQVLTDEEEEQITDIIEYMKPAHTHFRGFIEPIVPPDDPVRWSLGVSELGTETILGQRSEWWYVP